MQAVHVKEGKRRIDLKQKRKRRRRKGCAEMWNPRLPRCK
jgi:hypothetical protein